MTRRNKVTIAKVHKVSKMLDDKVPYAKIAADAKVSPATIGRIKAAKAGNLKNSSPNIVAILNEKQDRTVTAKTAKSKLGVALARIPVQKEDTHRRGLRETLDEFTVHLSKTMELAEKLQKLL